MAKLSTKEICRSVLKVTEDVNIPRITKSGLLSLIDLEPDGGVQNPKGWQALCNRKLAIALAELCRRGELFHTEFQLYSFPDLSSGPLFVWEKGDPYDESIEAALTQKAAERWRKRKVARQTKVYTHPKVRRYFGQIGFPIDGDAPSSKPWLELANIYINLRRSSWHTDPNSKADFIWYPWWVGKSAVGLNDEDPALQSDPKHDPFTEVEGSGLSNHQARMVAEMQVSDYRPHAVYLSRTASSEARTRHVYVANTLDLDQVKIFYSLRQLINSGKDFEIW